MVTGPAYTVQAAGTLAFSSTDTLELAICQNGAIGKASVRNISTASASLNCSYTYTFSELYPKQSMLNNSRMTIWPLGGNVTVNSMQWFVSEPINAEAIVYGDSKLDYFTTEYGYRFTDLLNEYWGTTINSGGVGDAAVDVLTRVNEGIGLKTKRALLVVGRNDIAHSIPGYIANYDSIVSRLTAAGIDVYHLLGFYEPALDQSPLVNHIIATYPGSKIIDCLTPTKRAGILVDGVHGNDAFHRVVFDAIMNSGKLSGGRYLEQNTIKNQNAYTQSGSFNIDGPGTFAGTLAQLQVTNQSVTGSNSPSLLNMGTTWNTSGTPTAFKISVTDLASNSASLLADLRVNAASVFSIGKDGKISHVGSSNGVQYNLKLPSGQTISNPAFQIQDATGAAVFAMTSNGPHNTYIGVGSGASMGTPSGAFGNSNNNTALGWMALNAGTTTNANTAIGEEAMFVTTTGNLNTAVGSRALFSNTTGVANVAIGQAANAFYTTGNNNVAVGENCLKGGTSAGATGSDNIALGTNCLLNNLTGAGNIAMGTQALLTASASSGNMVFGFRAGWTGGLGNNNILFGYQNCSASSLGTNNIMIGPNQSTSATVDNNTLIGNSLTSSISNIVGLGRSDQNVIIGNTTISADNGARLQVNGTGTITAPADADSTTAIPNTAWVKRNPANNWGALAVINDADYTVAAGVSSIIYKTMTAGRTLTLPAASANTSRVLILKNGGAGSFTITLSTAVRENSTTTTTTITVGAGYTLQSDGTDWWIINKSN
jgi:hypothetical protein